MGEYVHTNSALSRTPCRDPHTCTHTRARCARRKGQARSDHRQRPACCGANTHTHTHTHTHELCSHMHTHMHPHTHLCQLHDAGRLVVGKHVEAWGHLELPEEDAEVLVGRWRRHKRQPVVHGRSGRHPGLERRHPQLFSVVLGGATACWSVHAVLCVNTTLSIHP